MNKLRPTISILTLIILTIAAHGQADPIDHFKVKKNYVDVYFYDPLEALSKIENFSFKSDKEKSDALDNYLHNHALYLFVLIDSKTKDITYFCIRGNPEKMNTKMFYKVEVIQGITNNPFDPNTDNYSNKVVKVIDKVNCGGTLFESSSLFSKPENKDKVGNGIQLYGYFRRVQPYSEIKISMTNIIEQYEQE
jgi:hypothetical protein